MPGASEVISSTGPWERSYWTWEPNPGPLQEQQIRLSTESPLQPLVKDPICLL